MTNTREKTAGAIIDIFFAKGAQISKKEYDEVLTILSEERSRVLEEAKLAVREYFAELGIPEPSLTKESLLHLLNSLKGN